jgi:3-phosphoshikimate 1-carboxyvinyltransferase
LYNRRRAHRPIEKRLLMDNEIPDGRPMAAAHAAAGSMVSHPASAPLSGRIAVPGDKSISHRALMFGALAIGETRITGLLTGEDVLRTAAAMRALGARITHDSTDANGAGGMWRVAGRGVGGLTEPADVLDMGNSGTAARLLCGILASHPIFSVMTGDASLRRRPMRRVIDPLMATGARFASRGLGLLPLAIEGAHEALPLDYRVPVPSAQVKSAVLLAGLNARGLTRVEEKEATRDHSENMLRHFGATVHVDIAGKSRIITLQGQPELRAADVVVPGDPSSAAFPLVAALLVPGSSVTIPSVGLNPLRTGLQATLEEMGAQVTVADRRVEGGEPVGDLVVTGSSLRGVDVPPERAPTMIDEYPILAVAAAAATGTTRMRGLKELRVKESDRLAATAALLTVNGVRAEIEGDDLLVHGTGRAPSGGGFVLTQMDHRIAMAALVLGLIAEQPVRIDDGGFIDTSFPGFAALMGQLGATISGA